MTTIQLVYPYTVCRKFPLFKDSFINILKKTSLVSQFVDCLIGNPGAMCHVVKTWWMSKQADIFREDSIIQTDHWAERNINSWVLPRQYGDIPTQLVLFFTSSSDDGDVIVKQSYPSATHYLFYPYRDGSTLLLINCSTLTEMGLLCYSLPFLPLQRWVDSATH